MRLLGFSCILQDIILSSFDIPFTLHTFQWQLYFISRRAPDVQILSHGRSYVHRMHRTTNHTWLSGIVKRLEVRNGLAETRIGQAESVSALRLNTTCRELRSSSDTL